MKRYLLLGLILVSLLPIHIATAQEPETYTITIHNNFFDPEVLHVEVKDNVVFEWAATASGHNVAQVEQEGQIVHEKGFRSGEPQSGPATWELPSEYTSESQVLYFICEPHGSSNMMGKIFVGDTTEDNVSIFSVFFVISSLLILAVIKPWSSNRPL